MKLTDLEALCKAAAPAPWRWSHDDLEKESATRKVPWRTADIVDGEGGKVINRDSGHYLSHLPSAEFIIASRRAMPLLVRLWRNAKGYRDTLDEEQIMRLIREREEILSALEKENI